MRSTPHDSPHATARGWLPRAAWAGALVAFVATRVWLLAAFTPLMNRDVATFFNYAIDGVDLKETAYRDTKIEYPPVAWWTIAWPRWFASEPFYRVYLVQGNIADFQQAYTRRFRWTMAAFDVASFLLLLDLVRRRWPRRLASAAWAYTLATALQPHVLYDRLDIGLLFFLLLWAWAWLCGGQSQAAWAWRWLAAAALGLGVSYKLIPLVIVPVWLAGMASAAREFGPLATLKRNAAELLVFSIAAVGPFAYHYRLAGSGVFELFAFHRLRGIEIESVHATVLMLLRPLGLEVACESSYGSTNLASPLSPFLAKLSSLLVLAVMGVAAWRTRRDPGHDRARAIFRWGLLAVLAAVVVSKVISVQYMLWTLPLLVLLGCDVLGSRAWRWLIGMTVAMAALSTAVYPYLFFPGEMRWGDPANPSIWINRWPLAPDLHPLAVAALAARNALLVAAVWLVGAQVWSGSPAESAHSGD